MVHLSIHENTFKSMGWYHLCEYDKIVYSKFIVDRRGYLLRFILSFYNPQTFHLLSSSSSLYRPMAFDIKVGLMYPHGADFDVGTESLCL